MNHDIISVEHLTKSFGEKKAVDDLSFSVPKGSLFAFLGQNGAGKSTTINMIIGLLKKDDGRIRYNGEQDFLSFKNQIGVVFQNNILDDLMTVEENLLLYGTLYMKNMSEVKSRYKDIISLLSMKDFEKKPFKVLSGGQKRKAEIARALFASPQILFMDEPTTGLDPRTRAEVWNIVQRIKKDTDMTVFLTTHYMEETAAADEVVIIHRGKKICEGSPIELKDRYSSDKLIITPENAELWEKQMSGKGITCEKVADTYRLKTTEVMKSIEFLYSMKENIRYYEALKGSMDDVFLNAVGENIGEEV